ncbi:hypothetical protein FSARC_882 [Fusarium sarcochroum]|uniref:Ferric oxidoreductase domain-containing protein n=1 Tax=Fusarium sarcochroum TaxID=1208366 RepID=A0A8H4UAN3_9HYPO|nr:hypothetical protein FSARC_882 [Fusarium sarcochroum]
MTEPACYASNNIFLRTLAWCISTRCPDFSVWKLERYWAANAAGSDNVQPDPKETYQQALSKVNGTLTAIYAGTDHLNKTCVVSYDLWYTNYRTDARDSSVWIYNTHHVPTAALCTVSSSMGLSTLPCSGPTKHDAPWFFGLAQAPKRGQALFIFYFVIINTVVSAINDQYADRNTWYPGDVWRWTYVYVKNRTHATESQKPYRYWGIVGTLGMVIFFLMSVAPIRKKFYALFLT